MDLQALAKILDDAAFNTFHAVTVSYHRSNAAEGSRLTTSHRTTFYVDHKFATSSQRSRDVYDVTIHHHRLITIEKRHLGNYDTNSDSYTYYGDSQRWEIETKRGLQTFLQRLTNVYSNSVGSCESIEMPTNWIATYLNNWKAG